METDDVIAHQVPHIPKQHGSTVQSHHTTLDRVISRLEGKEYEHSYYNPFLENRVWKERQIQIETVWFPEPFIH